MNLRETLKNLDKKNKDEILRKIKNTSGQYFQQDDNAMLSTYLKTLGKVHIFDLKELADDYIDAIFTRNELIKLLDV